MAEGRRPDRRLRRGGLHQDPPGLQHVVRRRPRRACPTRSSPSRSARLMRGRRGHRAPHRIRRARCTSSAPRCPCPAARTRRSTSSPRRPPTGRGAPSPPTARRSPTPASSDVWPRVVALVVQPGVEFDHVNVIDYDRDATVELRTRARHRGQPRLRGALHRLPTARTASGARRGPLGDPQGRARPDVRDARGTVRAGDDRGRARARAPRGRT